jgi:DNA-binding transcriptional regulator LsrR (DeoR family)
LSGVDTANLSRSEFWREIQILQLKAEGLTQRKIAQEVGLSLSKVNRIIKKAEEGPGYGLKP